MNPQNSEYRRIINETLTDMCEKALASDSKMVWISAYQVLDNFPAYEMIHWYKGELEAKIVGEE